MSDLNVLQDSKIVGMGFLNLEKADSDEKFDAIMQQIMGSLKNKDLVLIDNYSIGCDEDFYCVRVHSSLIMHNVDTQVSVLQHFDGYYQSNKGFVLTHKTNILKIGERSCTIDEAIAFVKAYEQKEAVTALYMSRAEMLFSMKSFKKGEKILLKLAKEGCAIAEYNLAMMYYNGETGAQNIDKYIHYLTRSANNKFPQAVYGLSSEYFSGELFEQNVPLALMRMQEAAMLGCEDALEYLASLQQIKEGE